MDSSKDPDFDGARTKERQQGQRTSYGDREEDQTQDVRPR